MHVAIVEPLNMAHDLLSPQKYINKEYITINNQYNTVILLLEHTEQRCVCACVRHVQVNSKNDNHQAVPWLRYQQTMALIHRLKETLVSLKASLKQNVEL